MNESDHLINWIKSVEARLDKLEGKGNDDLWIAWDGERSYYSPPGQAPVYVDVKLKSGKQLDGVLSSNLIWNWRQLIDPSCFVVAWRPTQTKRNT